MERLNKVLVNADAESRGAAMALADKDRRRRFLAVDATVEAKARERLRADRSTDGLNWYGLAPTAHRGKSARPAGTYRSARRNAARDAKLAARRRKRTEPQSE